MQFHMWPSVVFTDIRLKMWIGMRKKYDNSYIDRRKAPRLLMLEDYNIVHFTIC